MDTQLPIRLPVCERGLLLHEDDLAAQLALTVDNVEAQLAERRLGWGDVRRLEIHTSDPSGVGDLLDTVDGHLAEHGTAVELRVIGATGHLRPGMSVAIAATVSQPPASQPQPDDSQEAQQPEGTVMTITSTSAAETFRDLCGSEIAEIVHLPGEPAYDAGRVPWNLAAEQHPAAVAAPRSPREVRRVVRAAAAAGLRVAPQSTGHAAGVLVSHSLADVVLMRTSAMAGVRIDPVRRVARVEAGALWEHVVAAAAAHGLAALHGSAPDIGVVGYALGGGLGFYGRRYGLASNSVKAVEIVTANGRLVRADARHKRKLFWALRGAGGANFGVVTAIEIELIPVHEVYAGMMLWPLEHYQRVLRAWTEWSPTAPISATTSLRAMRFPPMPDLPGFLSGRSLVVLDGAFLDGPEAADRELAAFRALGPEMDTFGTMPAPGLTQIHMDPPTPTPSVGGSMLLTDLDEDGLTTLVSAAGPEADTSLLVIELRQLGGALAQTPRGAGSLDRVDAAYALFALAVAPSPEMATVGTASADAILAAMDPWGTGQQFLNLAERAVGVDKAFGAGAYDRLVRIRAKHDPDGMFVANHAL